MIPQQLERLYPTNLPWELQFIKGPLREHLARYRFVAGRFSNVRILDIACGSGYGSYILAHSNNVVEGVDISDEAILFAKQNYVQENLHFSIGSAEKLAFASDYFDVVVSFETIEHLQDGMRDAFLSEVRRVLRPGGVFYISTPENRGLSLGFSSSNPHHVREYSVEQFVKLFVNRFGVLGIFGQEIRARWLIRCFTICVNRWPLLGQRVWRLLNGLFFCSGEVRRWHTKGNSIPLYMLFELSKNE